MDSSEYSKTSEEDKAALDDQSHHSQMNQGHEISEEALQREERLLRARKEAAEAESRVEKARAAAIREERKARKSEDRKNILASILSSKLLIPAVIVIVIIVFSATLFGTGAFGNGEGPTVVTSSSLERLVNISKLSTAEFVYNGIAEQMDENGNVLYHVYYKSTVRAGVDMSEITFEVDEENRTVTPILPEIVVDQPLLDETSLELMPRNPNADLEELIALCKSDAMAEVQEDGQIYITAQENLQATIEALVGPLLDQNGYTLVWKSPSAEEQPEREEQSEPENEANQAGQEGNSDE